MVVITRIHLLMWTKSRRARYRLYILAQYVAVVRIAVDAGESKLGYSPRSCAASSKLVLY